MPYNGSRASALAKADFLRELNRTHIVEKLKDAWRKIAGPEPDREDYVAFLGEHDSDLDENMVTELLNWPEWEPA
jgi:hypothetical protein